MSKRQNILPARARFSISCAGKIESNYFIDNDSHVKIVCS